MIPAFYETEGKIEIHREKTRHITPHVHSAVECVLVTDGTLEVGVGTELYHMEKGDFAIIFPNMVHHYQNFDTERGKAYFLLIPPVIYEAFAEQVSSLCPAVPVIPAVTLGTEIPKLMQTIWQIAINNNIAILNRTKERIVPYSGNLFFGYAQILLARALPKLKLVSRDEMASDDDVYRIVQYITTHLCENITLNDMAHDLGMNPYSISRTFKKTFGVNMNTYINTKRLDVAEAKLRYSDYTITEIYEDAGFQSGRTFNRAFFDKYNMAPRDYRKMCRETELNEKGENE